MPELWVAQPPDLYAQVLALGNLFTRRLDLEDQEDFKQELLLEIFSRWHEFDPERGAMSNWITWRARGCYTTFRRIVNHRKYKQTNFEFDNDDVEVGAKNENWLFYRAPESFYKEDGMIDKDKGVQLLRKMIPFSEDELLVLEMKLDNRTLAEIALTLHGVPDIEIDELAELSPNRYAKISSGGRYAVPLCDQVPDELLAEARRVISSARRKLKAARAMANGITKPNEPVEAMVRLHIERKIPFNNTSFKLSAPSQGTKNLNGIHGVQEAIALNYGATTLRERLNFEIEIPTQRQKIACEFWEKYGKLIARCSSISVDDEAAPNRLIGVLPKEEAVADVLMGLTVTESIRRTEKIRGSAKYKPTQNDFAMLVWNLQNQGLLNGPAFDGAIETWRERLTNGKRKGRRPRIPQHVAVR